MNLRQEEICGHIVTEQTKKVWAVELECFSVFKELCEKHNLKYFASGGTLLGAVRHKGFIPWDDDMDVVMFCDDYLKFLDVAQREIKHPFFLQSFTTQEFSHISHSRIRKTTTTGCTEYEWNDLDKEKNYGIFIDIIPITFLADNRISQFVQRKKYAIYYLAIQGYNKEKKLQSGQSRNISYHHDKDLLVWKILKVFIRNRDRLYRRFIKVCDNNGKKTGEIGVIPYFGFNKKYIWNTAWFSEGVEMPFEDTTILVPVEYDKMLRHQFGNYMIFDKGNIQHTMKVVDPDTPFSITLFNEQNG